MGGRHLLFKRCLEDKIKKRIAYGVIGKKVLESGTVIYYLYTMFNQ